MKTLTNITSIRAVQIRNEQVTVRSPTVWILRCLSISRLCAKMARGYQLSSSYMNLKWNP